jgi:hypothetical protein
MVIELYERVAPPLSKTASHFNNLLKSAVKSQELQRFDRDGRPVISRS